MQRNSIQQTFTAALDALVAEIKKDRAILAVVLCGSLSHDTVWAKSDIDLVLVTIDDRKVENAGMSLNADGVNVHAVLMPRTEFRKVVEGSANNSFFHSFLAKGRLLYTTDPSIEGLCARLHTIGQRDTQLELLRAGTSALPPIDKAHKWFVTRADLDYTALWILYAATGLAAIEVIDAGMVADREVIPRAMGLNPALFDTIYVRLLNAKKTKASVVDALETVDRYLAGRAPSLFAPVIAYLREAGEARSCTELENHFKRHFDVTQVTTACEYLADQGLINKVSVTARLTKRSHVDVQELAFVCLNEAHRDEAPDEDEEWRPE